MNSKILSLLAGLTLTAHAALPIPSNAEADLVLGQVDFTSKVAPDPPGATTLTMPFSVVVDPTTGKIFVADAGNKRILRYGSATTLANGAPAEFVFGQLNFVERKDFAANSINPYGLFIDKRGRLWVADGQNHRVLMFENASARVTWFADKIFGQPNATTVNYGTARDKMYTPADICVDNADSLWVAELGNNRVLRFNNISSKLTGAEADGVLGQMDYVTSTVARGQARLPYPSSVSISANGSLYVACSYSSRIIRFDNAAALSNGSPANAVLGQPNFDTYDAGTGASQVSSAFGAWITPEDTLWVMDSGNSRLLRFNNASTKPNGAAADGVLGQPDFTSKQKNITRRGMDLSLSTKPWVDATGNLWMTDGSNNRVLRFSPPTPVIVPPTLDKTAPQLVLSTKIPKFVTKPKLPLKGTASDASGIKSVQYRLGKAPFKTAKGTTTWQIKLPLKKGKNTLTLLATDTAGNVSPSKLIKITRK
jgi:sugar lactone lactonase YvrE